MADGSRICSEQYLFKIEGIERTLGGAFETTNEDIGNFSEIIEDFIREFAACCCGRYERTPLVEIRSVVTFAINAIGWSKKIRLYQLRHAHNWAVAASAEEITEVEERGGVELYV